MFFMHSNMLIVRGMCGGRGLLDSLDGSLVYAALLFIFHFRNARLGKYNKFEQSSGAYEVSLGIFYLLV